MIMISLNIFAHVVTRVMPVFFLGLALGTKIMRNVLDYLAGESRNDCSGVCEFYRNLFVSFNLNSPGKGSQLANATYRNIFVRNMHFACV